MKLPKFIIQRFEPLAFLFLTNFAAVLNYVYQFINATATDGGGGNFKLGDFASLGVITSLTLLFSALTNQPLLRGATEMSRLDTDKEKVSRFYSASIIVAVTSFIILALSAIDSKTIYGVEDAGLILSIAVSILIMGSGIVFKGLITGKSAFLLLGISALVEPVTKVVFAVMGRVFGFGLFIVNLGTVLGAILTALSLFLISRKVYGKIHLQFQNSLSSLKEAFLSVRYSIFYLFLITLFFTLDIILVKRIATDMDADLYAKLSLVGKIIFFGVGPIVIVFFNRFLRSTSENDLIIANLAVVLVGLIPLLPLLFFPQILEILFSIEFDSSISSLFLPGSLFLSLTFLNAHFLITRKNFIGIPFLIFSLGFFVFMVEISSGDLNQITTAFLISNFLSFVFLFLSSLFINYKNRLLEFLPGRVTGKIN